MTMPAYRPGEGHCAHLNIIADGTFIRLTSSPADDSPVVGYTLELHAACGDCGEAMTFLGLPMGSNPSEPTCNLDGTEARMPLRPVSAPDDFGQHVPGFAIRRVD